VSGSEPMLLALCGGQPNVSRTGWNSQLLWGYTRSTAPGCVGDRFSQRRFGL